MCNMRQLAAVLHLYPVTLLWTDVCIGFDQLHMRVYHRRCASPLQINVILGFFSTSPQVACAYP